MTLAGTDTTASTLVIGTYAALSEPQIYERLTGELDGAVRPKSESGDHHHQDMEALSLGKLQELPYLVSAVSATVLTLTYTSIHHSLYPSVLQPFGPSLTKHLADKNPERLHQRIPPSLARRTRPSLARCPRFRPPPPPPSLTTA